jgi:hypothetical protein
VPAPAFPPVVRVAAAIEALGEESRVAALHAGLVQHGAASRPRRVIRDGRIDWAHGDAHAAEAALRRYVSATDRARANPAYYVAVLMRLARLLVSSGRLEEALGALYEGEAPIREHAGDELADELVVVARFLRRWKRWPAPRTAAIAAERSEADATAD